MITGVEANEGTQDGNGDGSGNRAGIVTETGVETREGTYIGNGDGIESSSGDGNGKREGERNVDGATKPIGHIKYGTYPVFNPELDTWRMIYATDDGVKLEMKSVKENIIKIASLQTKMYLQLSMLE